MRLLVLRASPVASSVWGRMTETRQRHDLIHESPARANACGRHGILSNGLGDAWDTTSVRLRRPLPALRAALEIEQDDKVRSRMQHTLWTLTSSSGYGGVTAVRQRRPRLSGDSFVEADHHTRTRMGAAGIPEYRAAPQ